MRARVRSRRDLHTRHDQRLRVHLVIERHGSQQTKQVPHAGGRQHCFALIPAGAAMIERTVTAAGNQSGVTRADEQQDGKDSRYANAALPLRSWKWLSLFVS